MNHTFIRILLRLLLVGMVVASLIGAAQPNRPVFAATWYVATVGSDSNSCSTLAAPCQSIQFTIDNRAGPGDTIVIAPGTYITNITIFKSLTLQGAGAGVTFIDGAGFDSVAKIGSESAVIYVNLSGLTFQHGQGGTAGGGITINNSNVVLTISNSNIVGNSANNGGGIRSQGQLVMTNVNLHGNTSLNGGGIDSVGFTSLTNVMIYANTAQNGGGIRNDGTMTVTNSLIGNGNQATGAGGGIYNQGTLIVAGSTITGNQAAGVGGGVYNGPSGQLTFSVGSIQGNTSQTAPGGGLYNLGTVTLTGVNVVDNEATNAPGGGIENSTMSQLNMTGGSISGNRAVNSLGGGIHNYAAAVLTQVTVGNNLGSGGGGVYNESIGRLTLGLSVIIRNTALNSYGGGVNNQGALTITQSSIVSNTANSLQGGGLYNKSIAHLTNVTISDNTSLNAVNSGGAIYNDGGTLDAMHATIAYNRAPSVVNITGTVSLINTIVAFSTGGSVNCSGVMTSHGNNLDSGNTCGFTGGSDTNTDPLLGPLADNGGGTLTRILYISSPAVDAADGAYCPSPVGVDQRGVTRPQGGACDIGAYEVVGFTTLGPVPILGNQCVTSTTTINSALAVGALQVGVNLGFTPRSALALTLYAPTRHPVNLMAFGTGDDAQNLDVLWNDGAAAGIITSTNHNINFPYYKYSHQPAQPLSALSGIGIRGNWRLEICNNSSSTGNLNRWTIVLPSIQNFRVFMPLIFNKR